MEKTAAPELMRVEVEKTHRACQIGKDSGLFTAPEVLDYDDQKGLAVFQRLPIKPMSGAFTWGKEKISAAACLGRALAVIHRELVLPDNMKTPLPEVLSFPRDEVFFHGDLSVSNVCVGERKTQIIIIDWQMTPLHGGRSTYGTRYFDIMWFISNLILRPDMRFLYSNPVDPVIRAFLNAYLNAAEFAYNPDTAATYAAMFFANEMPRSRNEILQYSIVKSRLLLPFSEAILKSFLKSLKMM
ncbi:MAG: phosphotransferase [Nitrospira sp.]